MTKLLLVICCFLMFAASAKAQAGATKQPVQPKPKMNIQLSDKICCCHFATGGDYCGIYCLCAAPTGGPETKTTKTCSIVDPLQPWSAVFERAEKRLFWDDLQRSIQ